MTDELDCNLVDAEPMKFDDDMSSQGQDVTPALVRSVERAQVHTSACPVERADAAASVDLGESAGALSSADSEESLGEIHFDASGEQPGAVSLPVLGESADSLKQVTESKDTTSKGVECEEHLKKDKNPKKDKTDCNKATDRPKAADSNKTAVPISNNRKIKIPQNKLGSAKSKVTKNDIKSSPGRPLVKDSSRSNK